MVAAVAMVAVAAVDPMVVVVALIAAAAVILDTLDFNSNSSLVCNTQTLVKNTVEIRFAHLKK